MITLNWLKVFSISFYVAFLILFILGGLNMIGDFIPFDPYFVSLYLHYTYLLLFSVFISSNQPVIFGQEVKILTGEDKKEAEKYTRERIEG